MSRTFRYLAAVALALLMSASARAQNTQSYEEEQVQRSPEASGAQPPTAIIPSAGLSDWIAYRRDLCCLGPVDGPHRMGTEFFIRGGPSIPIGGSMSSVLGVGWTIEGGARFMLFDEERINAWVVETALINSHNRGDRIDVIFPLRRPVANQIISTIDEFAILPAAVRAYNRTVVSLGVGKEKFLWGSAGSANQWRVGYDAGARYGSAKADFFYFTDRVIRRPHRTDVVGGAYAALHTDLEFPMGCCTCFGGARGEWAYTWSDILQRPSDVMEINALVTIGVRY